MVGDADFWEGVSSCLVSALESELWPFNALSWLEALPWLESSKRLLSLPSESLLPELRSQDSWLRWALA